jgi:hypothetical protein
MFSAAFLQPLVVCAIFSSLQAAADNQLEISQSVEGKPRKLSTSGFR